MDDQDLKPADIQGLSSRDAIVSFFDKLHWRTDARLTQTPAAMGITAEWLQRQVKHIERLALQADGAIPLGVYLVELTSVTVAATHGLASALRNRVGNYLLVLTDDYERLDFVLLERSLPATTTSTGTIMAGPTRQVSVRPHVLTVSRRNPSHEVHLRVLRRFTCTEADSDAQYEKLLSAYVVAEWSEPLFNNRALFSDYYLNVRLRERPEWQGRPEEAYHRMRELMSAARQQANGKAREATERLLVQPALQTLGFRATPVAVGNDAAQPHYNLFAPDAPDKPVALCLAYGWNRNLDGRDDTRDVVTPDENPGARVVTVLDSGAAPWAVVTNGKVWRLYSAGAHSRATNYYEIDLEETLAMSDPNVAFRYFWLFFRSAAFVPRDVMLEGQSRSLCFLDELVEESESYAKGLGERLKERVFEEVFPHLADGFIEHLRSQPPITGAQQGALLPVARQLALKKEPDEAFRRQVFQGTLTFLYRALFLLYAEARDLLPVKEVRGYWEHSLTRLKAEIAEKAGDIADEAPQKLHKAYRADSTALYDRLLELFAIVDKGRRDLNVPLYNGGLFLTSPEPGDTRSEAENARFLQTNRIPDRYLALGLDRLARDIDPKRQDLAPIDYKSLGVRQLGSIYEGLLEFQVRIASEKMAVVQGKRTEEVIPYRVAFANKAKVLTRGRGRDAEERVYRPGDVYLENDRRERKATGSYYTPDHIVKYIVQHTVGPVLEEKFERLRARFREAQQAYRNAQQRAEAFRKQGMRPDDPAKVVRGYEGLVDELFDLRVLDPAMGSGHFLVEAVDFICDRTIGQKDGFLQAFPWNPVTSFLQKTRQAILAEMERQGVTVDTGRLIDINLLKRHILKRCVYGVDLNPMAVELAKVSLWLDCFTLGAPLSFLDHHLKCGNSLIGTSVQEVMAALAPKENQTLSVFGNPLQGVLAATASMEKLRRIPDATVDEIASSRRLFVEIEAAQAPYKALLDIWVSQYFGNGFAEQYLTIGGHDYVEEIRSGGQKLSPEYREAITKGAGIGREKRFFHWDLEFPEAFVDLKVGNWKPADARGFDAVIGNPPFVDKKHIATELIEEDHYWQRSKRFLAARGIYDLYMLFVQLGIDLSRFGAGSCLLTPIPWLTQAEGGTLRDFLLSAGSLSIFDYSAEPHFKDALVKVIGVHVNRGTSTASIEIRGGRRPRIIPSVEVRRLFEGQIRIDVNIDYLSILEKIVSHSVSLSSVYTPTFGLRASSKERGGFAKDKFIRPKDECKNPVPYLESRELTETGILWGGRWLDYQPDEIYSARSPELFLNPKLLLPSLLSRKIIRATYDDSGFFADQSLVCISPRYQLPALPDPAAENRPSLKNLQRQLNAEVTSFFFGNCVVGEALGGGAIHATPGLVARLRVFLDPSLEYEGCDTDEEIARTCGFTDEERAAIHGWFAEEMGGAR
ncbi:MAG: TaqI-like C-terminal specificity domain-containing protein [Chloroflexota bacterium]|nr:TaqI-like C-terminal specificity domain-containing protein [Chloroflexota bacterium]